tara:strand:+ start:5536 stop:5880 length:345 start_codon:yes stop_codon:yes gene_type:complete
MNYKESRPWGTFENLLDETSCKVKKIVISPNNAPSYQYHYKREEIWIVIQGQGELKLNDEIHAIESSSVIHIPTEAKHQIRNTGSEDLIFIEIQRGEYFGEDDIVRLEDDYGRI